ncbi:Serine--tRNA ligase, mitochondrial, partial [Coemansia sp. RSA 2618]
MLGRTRALASLSRSIHPARRHKTYSRALNQPSFDYKFVRDNADQLLENAINRNVHNARPHRVGELYDEYRALETQNSQHRGTLNAVSKEIAVLAKGKKAVSPGDQEANRSAMAELRERAKVSKQMVHEIEAKLAVVEKQLRFEAARIPNVTHPDTPIGDESQARVVCIHGDLHNIKTMPVDGVNTQRLSDVEFRDHYDLVQSLGIVDIEAGAKVAGSRFHYWRGAGALLELALVQYAMTRAMAAGF